VEGTDPAIYLFEEPQLSSEHLSSGYDSTLAPIAKISLPANYVVDAADMVGDGEKDDRYIVIIKSPIRENSFKNPDETGIERIDLYEITPSASGYSEVSVTPTVVGHMPLALAVLTLLCFLTGIAFCSKTLFALESSFAGNYIVRLLSIDQETS